MTSTLERDGAHAVLRIRGEIDAAVAFEPYELAVELFEGTPPSDLEIDLGGVTFIDSTGLGSLVRIRELADEHGTTYGLRHATEQVRKLLSITGLDQGFDLR